MIGVIDVQVQAQAPGMPLPELQAFAGSPSSVRVRNVPRRVGQWDITSVTAVAVYPDGSSRTADCVLAGGVWVGTLPGCPVAGRSENGFTIYAGGTDENGGAVQGYVLGKGDVVIYQADGQLSPDAPTVYVHLLSGEPATPRDGDMYQTAGGYAVCQNGAARELGASLSACAYGDTWTPHGMPASWEIVSGPSYVYVQDDDMYMWELVTKYNRGSTPVVETQYARGQPPADAVELEYSIDDETNFSFTRNPAGYVLAGQPGKQLAAYGDYATRAQVSAIVEAYLSAQNGGED